MMEEDILNYSPNVMFRGTPCKKIINFIFFYLCVKSKPEKKQDHKVLPVMSRKFSLFSFQFSVHWHGYNLCYPDLFYVGLSCACDYDKLNWKCNGKIIYYYPIFDIRTVYTNIVTNSRKQWRRSDMKFVFAQLTA